MICPLHGYVIRKDIGKYIDAYMKWALYEPEEKGVLILYSSPYGNTQNAAEIVASHLAEDGVDKIKIMDVSRKDPMEVLPEVFRYSNLLVAANTYNAEIFIKMEEALVEMKSMGVQNKKVSVIQNGSWNPASGKKVVEFFQGLQKITFVGDMVTVRSSVKEETRAELEKLAQDIAEDIKEA